MSEAIYKLQPNRTVALRGFDHLGASAAVHSASETGFTVSGQFRDASDFAVVVLYDADDFYAHPSLKPLPDTDFSGLTLSFDVDYSGLMPLNCRKYATIDWPYLDLVDSAGNPDRIRLSDYATVTANPDSPASGQFDVTGTSLQGYERLTLWYQNVAFDYTVPGPLACTFTYYGGQPGAVHSLSIGAETVSVAEPLPGGASGAEIAAQLAFQASFIAGYIVTANANTITVQTNLDSGAGVVCSASDGNGAATIWHVQLTTVARALRDYINQANYALAQTPYSLQAELVAPTALRISTIEGGYDANFITLYATANSSRLATVQAAVKLSGGASTARLHVSLDFSAILVPTPQRPARQPDIRSMWLTLAPRLADAVDYAGESFEAVFSNWTVSGAESQRRLPVAARGSQRVSSVDGRCQYSSHWGVETGYYQDNFIHAASQLNEWVSIHYECWQTHDVWIGTSLYPDRGAASVRLDGLLVGTLNTSLTMDLRDPAVIGRRKVASAVAAGYHTLELRLTSNQPFYFEYLDAVVAGDVPVAPPSQAFATPALDYSTDHSYKLPPARILWMLDQLGYSGPLNQYLGVFWWNERQRVGGVFPEVSITFGGSWQSGDEAFVNIGGQVCGKSVFPNEDAAVIAQHFAYFINETYVGVWARVETATTLVVRARSASDAYAYTVTASVTSAGGTVSGGGTLSGGSSGDWVVDPSATHTLNVGARAWHQDLFELCAAQGRPVTTAISMELVQPPEGFAAAYADNTPVVTQTGFGTLNSTHCAFSSPMRTFQSRVFLELAGLQAAAGLTPELQFGEFTWWYLSATSEECPDGSMGYYDAETQVAAQTALGRALHVFHRPDDDPEVNGGTDVAFLRNRLRDYAGALRDAVRAVYPAAKFEVLYPYDVNYPQVSGVHGLGGRLNRAVNLPLEWNAKETSGFDRFKIEALDFSAWTRNSDLVRTCLEFPIGLGWAPAQVRAMVPVFRGGYPWERDVDMAKELKLNGVSLWAFDHVCLFGLHGWPKGKGRAFRRG